MTNESASDKLERELIEYIAGFTHDPLSFVLAAWPWGKAGTSLEKHKGPRKWQREVLKEIGDHLRKGCTFGESMQPYLSAVASGHGSGKAHPMSMDTDTPIGRRQWGSLRPGDLVFGSDGAPVRVAQVHLQGVRKIYRVTFDDRSSTLCDAEHLWNVRGRQERRKKIAGWRTLSAQDIVALGVKRPNGAGIARQWEIPVQGEAQFPLSAQAIHPYVVGIWIGDGTKGSPSYGKPYEEIREKIRGLGYALSVDRTGMHNRFLGCASLFRGGVFDLGSHERYIPDAYKYASVEQRRNLLCGLLDSDGEANSCGSIGYASTSERLIDDVIWLVRSLGGKAMRQEADKLGWYPDENGQRVECRLCYRCTINLPWNPFTLKHRRDAYKPSEHRYLVRWIDSIEYSHDEEAMCITVDADDHLYLCNDFIVTHNSALVSFVTLWALCTCQNTRGVVTANTEAQLRTKTWPELAKWFTMLICSHWFEAEAMSIHARGSMAVQKAWRIDAIPWSENNTEAFAGLHNEGARLLLIFDEASAIADKVWEVSEGALTDADTEILWLVFGNPTRNSGRFRECFRKNAHRWHTRQIDCRTVEGINLEQLAKVVADNGEESDLVKVRIRGMFPSSSAMQFIATADVDYAFGRDIKSESYSFAPVILTCDPSWTGEDPLIIGLRQGNMFRVLREMPKNDNDVQVATILAMLQDEHKADAVFIDFGYGTGIYSAGIAMGRVGWQMVQFGSAAPNPGFVNMRAWIWDQMKQWLKMGGAIPPDHGLYTELCGPETIPRLDGRVQLESKQDMKDRGLPSPNKADALAISFAFPVSKRDTIRTSQPQTALVATTANYDPLRRRR